ncbi:CBO0543 family protein [Texcoconibacillus texcoconensis]|uniref:Uncharacterized protein n=1 Tax=Texcoconibacillus texcoconensis TaxID=1095777 RepID=A0A840QLR0_9BACI|nr:CBO0543 family protein [Texcoconibacillus texcoconensis]MBB5172280.1 hypothetical protein [Texcoconibacillus texcoconensis]
MEGKTTWDDIVELSQQLKEANFDYWLNENVFTFNWWLLFVLSVSLFIIWIAILDKKRVVEVVTYGLMVALTAEVLDVFGVSFMLWGYPYKATPLVPPILTIHLGMMPYLYMMVYQKFTGWKSFNSVMLLLAIVFAFVLEPILIWLQIYEMYQWEHIYSFPFYFIIGVIFKWLVQKFMQMDHHY